MKDNHSVSFGLSLMYQNKLEFGTMVYVGINKSKDLRNYCDKFKNMFAFEPNPYSFDRLHLDKVEYNLFPNVELYKLALSNYIGSSEFICIDDEHNIGSSALIANEKHVIDSYNGSFHKVMVKVQKLDNILSNIKRIDFLKIDAEYEDMRVIQGGWNLIQTHKPLIQVETIDNTTRSSLLDIGYSMITTKYSVDNFFVYNH